MTRRILHVIPSMDPASGGMAEATRVLAHAAPQMDSVIVTCDAPDKPRLSRLSVRIVGGGPGRTRFLWTPRLASVLQDEMRRADVCVAHGLWQHPLFAASREAQRQNKPLFVFPHGMLDPWALAQSRMVKSLAWLVGMRGILNRSAAALCFTTKEEMALAAPMVSHAKGRQVIVPLGVEAPALVRAEVRDALDKQYPALVGRQIFLFLGRLHPKKGCDMLIQAFAEYCRQHDKQQLPRPHLRLVGPPCNEEYLHELRAIVEREKISEGADLVFLGMLEGEAKWRELASADVLILPSHQENFGLVVAEALACGTPTLLSDKVNTAPQVKTAGAGLMAPDTPEGTLHLLQQWMSLSAEERATMSLRARSLYSESFSADSSRAGFARLVEEMVPQ